MTSDNNPNGIPSGSQPKRGRILFWKCPAQCGGPVEWDKSVKPPIARCMCGHTNAPSLTEEQKTARGMAALDTMATVWAAGFDIRGAVKAMMSLPDGEDRLIAFVKQAHVEGLYEGRTSHNQQGGA